MQVRILAYPTPFRENATPSAPQCFYDTLGIIAKKATNLEHNFANQQRGAIVWTIGLVESSAQQHPSLRGKTKPIFKPTEMKGILI